MFKINNIIVLLSKKDIIMFYLNDKGGKKSHSV